MQISSIFQDEETILGQADRIIQIAGFFFLSNQSCFVLFLFYFETTLCKKRRGQFQNKTGNTKQDSPLFEDTLTPQPRCVSHLYDFQTLLCCFRLYLNTLRLPSATTVCLVSQVQELDVQRSSVLLLGRVWKIKFITFNQGFSGIHILMQIVEFAFCDQFLCRIALLKKSSYEPYKFSLFQWHFQVYLYLGFERNSFHLQTLINLYCEVPSFGAADWIRVETVNLYILSCHFFGYSH